MRLLALYAAASWASLFWIDGILSWQLTPGPATTRVGRVLQRELLAVAALSHVRRDGARRARGVRRDQHDGHRARAARCADPRARRGSRSPMVAMPLLALWYLAVIPRRQPVVAARRQRRDDDVRRDRGRRVAADRRVRGRRAGRASGCTSAARRRRCCSRSRSARPRPASSCARARASRTRARRAVLELDPPVRGRGSCARAARSPTIRIRCATRRATRPPQLVRGAKVERALCDACHTMHGAQRARRADAHVDRRPAAPQHREAAATPRASCRRSPATPTTSRRSSQLLALGSAPARRRRGRSTRGRRRRSRAGSTEARAAVIWPFDDGGAVLVLYVATLALHAAFVGYVVAPAPRTALRPPRRRVAEIVRDRLPFMLGCGITAGVAPLLFVQLLYQQRFYTANLLLGPRWLAVVPALIVGFYALYLAKHAPQRWRPRRARDRARVLRVRRVVVERAARADARRRRVARVLRRGATLFTERRDRAAARRPRRRDGRDVRDWSRRGRRMPPRGAGSRVIALFARARHARGAAWLVRAPGSRSTARRSRGCRARGRARRRVSPRGRSACARAAAIARSRSRPPAARRAASRRSSCARRRGSRCSRHRTRSQTARAARGCSRLALAAGALAVAWVLWLARRG